MTEETYKAFQPGKREVDTRIPVENYTPLNWELTLQMFGRRFGLLPEIVTNANAFHAAGMEPVLIKNAREANLLSDDLLENKVDTEKSVEIFSERSIAAQMELSAVAANAALTLFSQEKGALIAIEGKDEELDEDLSAILPHESHVRQEIKTKGIKNEKKVIQAYRTLYSMTQLMYFTFTGEVDDVRTMFKINPEIYLSCLTYIASMASAKLSDEIVGRNTQPTDALASYLFENNGRALADAYFTVDLAETAPDVTDTHVLTHFLTAHSRLLGILGDTLFLTKLFRNSDLKEVPIGLSSLHKDDTLITLIYGDRDNYTWFNLIEPPSETMPLLQLLKLGMAPEFARELDELIKEGKVAVHATWKNALRIFADNIHDGINFRPYLVQLSELLRKNELIPSEGLLLGPHRILDMLAELKLIGPAQLARALDPQTYNVPNAYKFRFFVEDGCFDALTDLLRQDIRQKPATDGYRPFFLFVDPEDNSKVVRIDIDSLENPRQTMLNQFAKGGRAMLFIHLAFPALEQRQPKKSDRIIDLQFTLMSRVTEFNEQRINYGEARLVGKPR